MRPILGWRQRKMAKKREIEQLRSENDLLRARVDKQNQLIERFIACHPELAKEYKPFRPWLQLEEELVATT